MPFKNNSPGVRKVEISLNVPPHIGNGEVNSVGKVLKTSAANRQCNGSFCQKIRAFSNGGVTRGGSNQVMVLRWPG